MAVYGVGDSCAVVAADIEKRAGLSSAARTREVPPAEGGLYACEEFDIVGTVGENGTRRCKGQRSGAQSMCMRVT